jgi:hypothetical protein
VLKLNEDGVWLCTGNKLEYWNKEFEIFSKLSKKDKEIYMSTVENQSKFNELQNKFKNNNDKLECEFVTAIFAATPSYSTSIPDPVIVGRIERQFRRNLTEEEKYGEVDLFVKDNKYSLTKEEGYTKIKIPMVVFPDEA